MKKSINLLNFLNFFLLKNKIIKPTKTYLLAISGGQDSISLFFIFYILKKQWNINIYCIYCNHLWNKETFYNYLHLSKIFFSFKINFFYILTIKKIYSEQRARNWRLKMYFRLLSFSKSNTIITGHTESDVSETFLLNFFRGSGTTGLSSVKTRKNFTQIRKNFFRNSNDDFSKFKKLKKKFFFKKTIVQKIFFKKIFIQSNLFFIFKQKRTSFNILRPLLTLSRYSIHQTTIDLKLPIFPDKTNEKICYQRNRLRKQLLPYLRFFFNPKIDLIVSKYTNVLLTEEQIIDSLMNQIFNQLIFEQTNLYCLNISLFCSFPLGIQRKVCLFFLTKKLQVKTNFFTINLFILLLESLNINKQNKNEEIFLKNTCRWIFFPKVGLIFIYKTVITIYK